MKKLLRHPNMPAGAFLVLALCALSADWYSATLFLLIVAYALWTVLGDN